MLRGRMLLQRRPGAKVDFVGRMVYAVPAPGQQPGVRRLLSRAGTSPRVVPHVCGSRTHIWGWARALVLGWYWAGAGAFAGGRLRVAPAEPRTQPPGCPMSVKHQSPKSQ